MWLGAIAALVFATPSDAPVAVVAADAVCHASVDEAAIQALAQAMALSSSIEHGGAIYQRGEGCFVFSTPVTNGKPMHVQFRVRTSRMLQLAGLYHTHPDNGRPDVFSGNDVLQARVSKVPSFIGVHGFNHVRKLRPGFADYGPGLLMDRALLRRDGVKGTVLAQLPEPLARVGDKG